MSLYFRECFNVVELRAGNKIKSLWVRIMGRANKADILVGFCYRLPNQQLAEVARSAALALKGDFNILYIFWKYNIVQKKQYGKILEYVEDNFLTQMVRKRW